MRVQVGCFLTVFGCSTVISQSGVDNEAANKDYEKAKNDVILNVITLYTSVIFNTELFQNAQFQLATTTEQLEPAREN
jgi:outer membrane protein TolC